MDAILIQKILIFSQLLFFSKFLVIKTLDTDLDMRIEKCGSTTLAKTLPIPKLPSDDVLA
jgi:hypothetical protein